MIEALVASGIAILVYRAIILPFELEHALDQYENETAALPQPPVQQNDPNLVELLIAQNHEVTTELLSLVNTLSINAAGAEKAAKFASRTAAQAEYARIEADREDPDLEGYPDMGSDRGDQRQSYLAEALAQIETPDGGRLVDP